MFNNYNIIKYQSSSIQSNAAALSVQWEGGSLVYNVTWSTKLVEAPVVDNLPSLLEALYSGAKYSSGSTLKSSTGLNQITGIGSNILEGYYSSIWWLFLSQRAPSIYKP